MSTYVLVHGAWHGAWCWKRVRRILQSLGHDVFTPTLTGLADRSHLLSREVNLDTHIDDIVNLIRWEELSDVILCGHSYGGFVISGVADRIPDRIGSLVYLDAFVPEDGENLLQLALEESQRNSALEAANAADDGWKAPPIRGEAFNVNSNDLAWMNSQCTPHPLACFVQPLRLGEGSRKIRDVLYVLATGWENSAFPKSYERAQARGWKTMTISCGHDVMLDAPEKLSDVLTGVALKSATA